MGANGAGIDMAKCYLKCCGYSLVVVRDCVEIVSHERGIMPLLMVYDKCPGKLVGAVLADKVIGKAAAFILAETGIMEVYAELMSERAVPVLEGKGIKFSYGRLVPEIMNRAGDGPCPMEKLCRDIDEPIEGIMALTAFICRRNNCKENPGTDGTRNKTFYNS